MQVFVHTIGTSTLNNLIKNKVVQYQNFTISNLLKMTTLTAQELNVEQQEFLAAFQQVDVSGLSVEEVSAELNALSHYRQSNPNLISDNIDIHYLVHTDTATGEMAAVLVKKMMQNLGISQVNLVSIAGLNTRNTKEFQSGIKALFSWLNDELTNYQTSKTPIIFNLNGGFKSLQGYMNTAGMFYADRIIYIFESGEDLVEIPKLPISLDKDSIQTYATQFLVASVISDYINSDYLNDIADVYKEVEDGFVTLSPIGILAWSQYERQILVEELLKFPHIQYESSFVDDFKNRPRDVVKLQKTLAKVSYILSENNGDIRKLRDDNGLRYENYVQNSSIGHFRVNQETRVSCRVQGKNLLLLHFGEHDYVNSMI